MPLLDETSRLQMLLKQFGGTNYTPPSSYVVAAVTTVPDDLEGNGLTEPEDAAYSRLTIPNTSAEFGLSASGTEVVNLNNWEFARATEDWGTVFGLALFNNSGTYLGYLPFATPRVIESSHMMRIKAGSFVATMDSTPLSVTIEEALMPTVLTAPNGNRYSLAVNNSGVLVLTPTSFYGVPAAPTGLANSSGILSWTPSTNNGGSPIISQTVWISDENDELVVFEVLPPDATSFDTDGYSGWFYVTADNPVGSSAPSNSVNNW